MKKVLILSGSPRKGGNSDLLCDEFMRGAIENGNQVEKIRVAEKKIGYCRACYYCRDHGGESSHKGKSYRSARNKQIEQERDADTDDISPYGFKRYAERFF